MKIFYKRKQILGFALSAAIVSNSLVVGNATGVEASEDNEKNREIGNEIVEIKIEDTQMEQVSKQRSAGDTYKVVVDSLNVRTGPGANYSILGSLKNGAIVEVQSITNGWAKISFNGKVGYCSANSKYLEKTATRMKVIADSLNVRTGPGTNYSVLGNLKNDSVVEVQSITNGWAKINFNGKVGYCSASSKYLQATTDAPAGGVSTPVEESMDPTTTNAKVTADVNLRETASWSGNKIMVIKKGAAVEVVSKSADWTKVKYSGKTGYVPTECVSGGTTNGGSANTPIVTSAKVTTDVNLRETASWSGNKIMVIKKGTAVEVVSKSADWTKVKYSGKTGYVPTEYVSGGTTNSGTGESTPQGDMVSVKDATWLRKTDSWSADKMVLLQKGDKAKFISRTADWVKVNYNGQIGYLTADYVLNVPDTGNESESELKQYKVTTDVLNVRSGPGTNYDKIGSVKNGQIIELYSVTSGWAKIKYGTTTGYVSADYITVYNGNGTSNAGAGKKVYLDPGHGGADAGAIGTTYGTKEKDVALDVTKRVASKLRDDGYVVEESRTTDVYPSLSQRYNDANNKGADIFVSMHFNSATASSAQGIETLYRVDGRTSNVLADQIQDEMIDATGLRNRGLKQRSDLAVLNGTKMPAVLVEGGFLSNSSEENLIKSASYRETLANAIVRGIEDYFKVAK